MKQVSERKKLRSNFCRRSIRECKILSVCPLKNAKNVAHYYRLYIRQQLLNNSVGRLDFFLSLKANFLVSQGGFCDFSSFAMARSEAANFILRAHSLITGHFGMRRARAARSSKKNDWSGSCGASKLRLNAPSARRRRADAAQTPRARCVSRRAPLALTCQAERVARLSRPTPSARRCDGRRATFNERTNETRRLFARHRSLARHSPRPRARRFNPAGSFYRPI